MDYYSDIYSIRAIAMVLKWPRRHIFSFISIQYIKIRHFFAKIFGPWADILTFYSECISPWVIWVIEQHSDSVYVKDICFPPHKLRFIEMVREGRKGAVWAAFMMRKSTKSFAWQIATRNIVTWLWPLMAFTAMKSL